MSDTRAQVDQIINDNITTNGAEQITGAVLNSVLKSITAAYLNISSDAALIGVKDYISSGRTYQAGEGCFNGIVLFKANKTTGDKAFDAADWDAVSSPGGSGSGLISVVPDISTLLLDTSNYDPGQVFEVTDASDDPTVDSGKAWYRYIGTGSTLADFSKISEEEAFSENLHQPNTDQFNLPGITNITGLKAIPTAGLILGSFIQYRDDGDNGLKSYSLIGATDAESLPDTVRPDDYAAVTNERVWKLAEVGSGSGTSTPQRTLPAIENVVELRTITTADKALGEHIFYLDTDFDEQRAYKLISGTDVENVPFIIRPADYAASTNERVWKYINPVDRREQTIGGNFNFDNQITNADPGDGNFRLNSGTLSLVAEIYLDNLSDSGNNVAPIIDLLEAGNKIFISQVNDATKGAVYEVDAVPVDETGYRSIAVSFLAELGGGIFDPGANCRIEFNLATSAGQSGAEIEHYRFENDLDTNIGSFGYTGAIDVLRIEQYFGFQGAIQFETALDGASPVFVQHLNIAALNAWLDANVSGDSDTGTKWLINFFANPDQATGFDFVYIRP